METQQNQLKPIKTEVEWKYKKTQLNTINLETYNQINL